MDLKGWVKSKEMQGKEVGIGRMGDKEPWGWGGQSQGLGEREGETEGVTSPADPAPTPHS